MSINLRLPTSPIAHAGTRTLTSRSVFGNLIIWTHRVTAEKDQLTKGESPCDGMKRQLAGGNRPQWDSRGLAVHDCRLSCLAAYRVTPVSYEEANKENTPRVCESERRLNGLLVDTVF